MISDAGELRDGDAERRREAEERNKFEKAQTALEEQREKTAEIDDQFHCLDYGLT